MKRILSVLMIAFMAISLTSCNWFKKSEQTKEQPTVETYIESDMKYMAENYGEVYVWYETEVIYNDFLDEENDGSIESIKSVFQHEKVVDSGAYVKVVTITHNGDLMDVEAVDGWYAECYNMRGKELPVTFKDAYDAIMAVNLPSSCVPLEEWLSLSSLVHFSLPLFLEAVQCDCALATSVHIYAVRLQHFA